MRNISLIAGALLVVMALTTCSDSSPTPTAPDAPAPEPPAPSASQLAVELTSTGAPRHIEIDSQDYEVQAIQVYITGLTVKRVGQPEERIFSSPEPRNGLDLTDGLTQLLASVMAEPGQYEYILVGLERQGQVWLNGPKSCNSDYYDDYGQLPLPLRYPSREIRVLGEFEVVAEKTTTLTLEFDVEESQLRYVADCEMQITPVITLANVSQG